MTHALRPAALFLVLICVLGAWPAQAGKPLPPNVTADRVLIDKSDHRLTLFRDGKILKSYPISLGCGGLARKRFEGDGLTPEGFYTIDGRNPKSAFYRSLHISYPNAADTAYAKARGKSPGGNIMIHGIVRYFGFFGKAQRLIDWTRGCVAVTNREMKELWRAVPDGTPVEIRQ